jgi:hypothetical protein
MAVRLATADAGPAGYRWLCPIGAQVSDVGSGLGRPGLAGSVFDAAPGHAKTRE